MLPKYARREAAPNNQAGSATFFTVPQHFRSMRFEKQFPRLSMAQNEHFPIMTRRRTGWNRGSALNDTKKAVSTVAAGKPSIPGQKSERPAGTLPLSMWPECQALFQTLSFSTLFLANPRPMIPIISIRTTFYGIFSVFALSCFFGVNFSRLGCNPEGSKEEPRMFLELFFYFRDVSVNSI